MPYAVKGRLKAGLSPKWKCVRCLSSKIGDLTKEEKNQCVST